MLLVVVWLGGSFGHFAQEPEQRASRAGREPWRLIRNDDPQLPAWASGAVVGFFGRRALCSDSSSALSAA
ncbi:hypothetical protein Acsp04_67040 [Actinomadura sp. NBRC 104425]|nr:hypothetical protein Acsp04_67040 [Actinomadura sp. NBRC 104425]